MFTAQIKQEAISRNQDVKMKPNQVKGLRQGGRENSPKSNKVNKWMIMQ